MALRKYEKAIKVYDFIIDFDKTSYAYFYKGLC